VAVRGAGDQVLDFAPIDPLKRSGDAGHMTRAS
jgi:hypothetical protein